MIRRLIGICAICLIGVVIGACGSGTRAVTTKSHSTERKVASIEGERPAALRLKGDEDDDDSVANRTTDTSLDDDSDFDNDSKGLEPKTYYDSDDAPILKYGQAVSAADGRTISTLVTGYYAAAKAADGARACGLMFSLFAEAIPEDYGRAPGPAYSRGNSCAEVMSKLFKHQHSGIPSHVVVTAARENGDQGRALIGSRTAPAGYLLLRRERGVWKIDNLIALHLP